MNPDPATVEAIPPRKKSRRARWLVALVGLVGLLVTTVVMWQRILARVRATPPEVLVYAAVATWATTVLAMYLWRIGSLLRARRGTRRSEEKTLARLQHHVDVAVTEFGELAAVTMEWAVRAELMRDDVEDVQEYMQRLVKRPHIRRALVAKADGTIVGSGDRAQRGQAIAKLIPELPGDLSKLQMIEIADNRTLFVVPVMGLESRLGTLALEIARPVFPGMDKPR